MEMVAWCDAVVVLSHKTCSESTCVGVTSFRMGDTRVLLTNPCHTYGSSKPTRNPPTNTNGHKLLGL